MGTAFSSTVRIDRPIEVVWQVLTDWSRAHEWMAGVESIRASGPLEAGTSLTFRARGKERPSEIVQLTPGQSITLQSTQGGVTAAYRYELRPIGDTQTEAALHADCTASGLGWTMLAPLIRAAMKRTDADQLDSLRSLLEQG